MEFTGTRLPAVRAEDLAEMVTAKGPIVTVYLPTPGDVENAAHAAETAWRSLHRDLEGWGAPEAALTAIEAEVPGAHERGDCLAAVATLAKRVGAEIVLVAGDVRAVGFLREHLPAAYAARLHEIEGGRGFGSGAGIDQEAQEHVRAAVDRETATVLEAFREEAAQHDLAVEGAANTLQALARAQVEVALVHDDLEDDRRAWLGPPASHVSAPRGAPQDLGVTPIQEGRLTDVVVRAALGTGAGIRVIPGEAGVADGIGGVLRW